MRAARASIAALLHVAAAAAAQPHIVVLLADDLGWAGVSWNNPEVQTPHLEELRAVLVPYDALVSLLVEEEPSLMASGLTLARLQALRESWEEQAVAVRSASDERALRDGASLGASKRAMWGPWVANYLACHF